MEAVTLQAMKEGGLFVISRADQSGEFSPRLFPRWWFDYMDCGVRTPFEKVQMIRHLSVCYFSKYKKMDAEKIKSAESCDRIAIETISAQKKVQKIFRFYGRTDLAEKVVVTPPILSDTVLSLPVPEKTGGKIITIGRWDAKQKNAPLLRDALKIFLTNRPGAEVTIIGRASKQVFGPLADEFPGVCCLGTIPRDAVPKHVAESSIYVYSSRWEGFNGAAHEGLALGCSVVGPADIPPVNDFAEHGDFGHPVAAANPNNLAAVLEKEVALWLSGGRDGPAIARYWREYLNPNRTLAAMVDHSETAGAVVVPRH